VRVAADELRAVGALEDVADALVPRVEAPGVRAVQEEHADAEIGLGRLEEQVVVIRQEAEREATPAKACYSRGNKTKKLGVVDLVLEDRLSSVAPSRHVEDAVGTLDATPMAHDRSVGAKSSQPGCDSIATRLQTQACNLVATRLRPFRA
jgi:hypothetical protein